jgi:CDP-diacylglycerol--glycerol-3-phosphate 3-phosphatidyltransferase
MTVSNYLTISRLVLSPIFIFVFLADGIWARLGAFAIVGINELTDLLDGIIARRRGETTDFGKLVDPLADSISHLTVFICFVAKGYAPVWMVALLVYRDLFVGYLRTVAGLQGRVLSARGIGKRKTMTQGLIIIIILLVDIFREYTEIVWFFQFSYVLVGLATLVTVVAGVEYAVANRHLLKRLKLGK